MKILPCYYEKIRSIDINSHKVMCKYGSWEKWLKDEESDSRIQLIKENLGTEFGRGELVEFYKADHDIETKFLATMIWGHEAPKNSKRDNRGPAKVLKTYNGLKDTPNLLASISVDNWESIRESYKALENGLKQCGPNFFTKHFYFLGKSKGIKKFPLIFDNRVANGLVKLSMNDTSVLDIVTVQAKTKPDSYLKYLKFAHDEADKIECEPDKIEYFLFES